VPALIEGFEMIYLAGLHCVIADGKSNLVRAPLRDRKMEKSNLVRAPLRDREAGKNISGF
jgi:hypothetical protein